MIALVIILAILLIIALLRFGATLEFSADGLFLWIKVAGIKRQILPVVEKAEKKPKEKKEKKQKKKKKRAEAEEEPQPEKKGGKLSMLRQLIKPAFKTMNRFRKKLRISRLIIHYTSASDDPFKTAMGYGYASAGIGAILPKLDKYLNIKSRQITTGVSFTDTEPTIYVHATLTMAVWEAMYIAAPLMGKLIKIIFASKNRKVETDGQASNQ